MNVFIIRLKMLLFWTIGPGDCSIMIRADDKKGVVNGKCQVKLMRNADTEHLDQSFAATPLGVLCFFGDVGKTLEEDFVAIGITNVYDPHAIANKWFSDSYFLL